MKSFASDWPRVDRRRFLQDALAAGAAPFVGGCAGLWGTEGVYPGWREGELDVHFIHTGVGEQTFFIFPDGTTMLLDCGDTHHWKYMRDVPAQPSDRMMGGEWTSRYLQRLIPQREIDYLLVSHWHGDHVGDPGLGGKTLPDGRVVAGITCVAEDFRFRVYSDHQYPHAGAHRLDPDPHAFRMMQEWLPRAARAGMRLEPFAVGARNQFGLVHAPRAFADFEIRNLCANAVIWDGAKGTVDCGRIHADATKKDAIHENRLSSALRIRYGKFSYYTGGDVELALTGADGRAYDWEARVGALCGPVDVAKTNHHAGHVGGMGAAFCRAVRAQAYLSSVWQPWMVHPESLGHMTAPRAGHCVVGYGYVAPQVRAAVAPYAGSILPAGHQVVKVAPGGATFRIYTLSAADESMRILGVRDFVSGSTEYVV